MISAMVLTRTPKNTTPMVQYLGVSVAYISAMFFSNYALQFISYPTQVLAKSCKPLPGMHMGRDPIRFDPIDPIDCSLCM